MKMLDSKKPWSKKRIKTTKSKSLIELASKLIKKSIRPLEGLSKSGTSLRITC